MVKIFEKQSGTPLGTLDDLQFQFLADHLEEESRQDDDYYLNRTTVDFLAGRRSRSRPPRHPAPGPRRPRRGGDPLGAVLTPHRRRPFQPSDCSACWSFWGSRQLSPDLRLPSQPPASSG